MKKTSILILFLAIGLSAIAQDSLRQVQIGDVHIIGNKKTKEKIILRELSVQIGESYPLKSLIDTLVFDRNRIYNTNLFNKVEVKVQELGDGMADLLIVVGERWYMYPLPIFKLADRNFNDWWVNQNHDFNRVNYGIRYTQYNFRGRNERLRLHLQSGFEKRFLFNYRLPYIDKTQRIGLMPEFILSTNNALGYKTTDHLRVFLDTEEQMRKVSGISVTGSYRKNFYDFHFLSMSLVSASIADTIAILNPDYLGRGRTSQQSLSIGYGYQVDRRDNINYPLSGGNFFAGITKTGLGVLGDLDYWTVTAVKSKYFDLNKGYYLGTSLWGMLSSGDRPFFYYKGLGFDRLLLVRSYELDLIEGQAYLMTKNSFRKLLWKHESNIKKVMPLEQFQSLPFAFYGKLFFDGAYVQSIKGYEGNDRLTDKFIYGLGVGVDMVTMYDFVVRFEYSTNRDRENQFFLNFQADF